MSSPRSLAPGPVASGRPGPGPGPGRLHSLDGLRGVAALVVLLHHPLLLLPSLATVYYAVDAPPALGTLAWVASYTPVHLVWAGTEAVYLFLVLSGVVLVLPVISRPRYDWAAYYPRRLIRLYGPVAAAVALGWVAYTVAPRFDAPGLGAWVNDRPDTYPGSALGLDLSLVAGHSGRISPLWSLQWEVLFSLLLPAFLLLLLPGRRADLLRAVALLALMAYGSMARVDALFYLPMFAVGVLTTLRWRSIEAWVTGWSARWRPFFAVLTVIAILLTCARWELTALGVTPASARDLAWLALPGVWLIVVVAWFAPGARRVLQTRFLQWAGRISFSLYLVHEPIVLSARFLTPTASPWVAIAIGIPSALVVAVVFERLVEAPSHRLARWIGRGVQRLRSRPTT